MTHNELVDVVWTAGRAFSAIKQFADPEVRQQLDKAELVLCEVRNAAQYVNDPENHDVAVERLLDLFRRPQL